MDKQKILLGSWYPEIPQLFKDEMLHKEVMIEQRNEEGPVKIKVIDFFIAPVIKEDPTSRKIEKQYCGVTDDQGSNYDFITIKLIETENFLFTPNWTP